MDCYLCHRANEIDSAAFEHYERRIAVIVTPEAEALMPGVTAEIMNSPYHQWVKGLSKEQIQQQIDFCKGKYNQ